MQVASGNPAARIHKGSPYFNLALCHFAAGDLERGFKFLAMTGDEHARAGGDPFPVLLGNHPLSRRFLIAPVVAELAPGWTVRYHELTNRNLDEAGLIALVMQGAQGGRPFGIQLLLALHRLRKASGAVQNDWTRYLRTRSLAEMLVALESMLRRIHVGHQGELQSQFEHLFGGRADYQQAFGLFHTDFRAIYDPLGGPDTRRTPGAVDWSVNRAPLSDCRCTPSEGEGWLAAPIQRCACATRCSTCWRLTCRFTTMRPSASICLPFAWLRSASPWMVRTGHYRHKAGWRCFVA